MIGAKVQTSEAERLSLKSYTSDRAVSDSLACYSIPCTTVCVFITSYFNNPGTSHCLGSKKFE